MNPKRYKMAKQTKPKKITKPSKPIRTLDEPGDCNVLRYNYHK
jgi:hypothetical protein